jgi:acyl-CoA thioesterase I
VTPIIGRRRLIGSAVLSPFASMASAASRTPPTTVFTFGDSILDCARYNEHGVHPGQLLVRNDDALFPEFKGRDLRSRGPAELAHRAVDGATVADLPRQVRGVSMPPGSALALLTIGGNDLLAGLAGDKGPGVRAFEASLDRFVRALPIRPVLLGTVYDPTFGDDSRNFLAVDARTARANLRRVNEVIGAVASRHGRLVDLHAHFLRGSPAWFTRTIEPSLIGASEVRRAFLDVLEGRRAQATGVQRIVKMQAR